jgi:hypothetical protein
VHYDIQYLEWILEPHIAGCLSPTRAELMWGIGVDLAEARIELVEVDIGLAEADIGLVEAGTEFHQVSGYTEAVLGPWLGLAVLAVVRGCSCDDDRR